MLKSDSTTACSSGELAGRGRVDFWVVGCVVGGVGKPCVIDSGEDFESAGADLVDEKGRVRTEARGREKDVWENINGTVTGWTAELTL